MSDADRDRYESWRVRHARGRSCSDIDRLRRQGMLEALRHETRSTVVPRQAAAAGPRPSAAGSVFAAGVAGAIRLYLRNNPEGDTPRA